MKANLILKRGDITQAEVDAIVNAANPYLAGGGGVDGAIHRAAGPKLLQACKQIIARRGKLNPGDAVITPGFNLPAKFVIHAVGPVWRGQEQEISLLAKTYQSCLNLAKEFKLKRVAFPAISCGAYGFPPKVGVKVAIESLLQGLTKNLVERVFFYCYNLEVWNLAQEIYQLEKE